MSNMVLDDYRVHASMRLALFFVLVAMVLVAGCENKTDEQILRERIHARWAAILALDFDKVYTFATPTYRKTHTITHFKNQYAAQVIRKGIEIREIQFDEEDPSIAKVRVLLSFETTGVQSGNVIDSIARINETWTKQDGQWWYVEPR